MTRREEILNVLTETCPRCSAFAGETIKYGSSRWKIYSSCRNCHFNLKGQTDTAGDFFLTLAEPWRIGARFSHAPY